jgi:Trypsin-like serine proteases, typically periplasmic, contain C-terminal PDZ domain
MGKSVSILILGLCIAGVHASAAYTAQGPAADSVLADMAHFQEVVSDVTGKVGAAVVSISTQRTARVSGLSRSVGDEMLDQFFRDFIYGDIPQREYTRIGLGSGVIIDQAGYIITNEHVISGAEK